MGIFASNMARRVKWRYLTSYSGLVFLLGVFLIGGLWLFVQYQVNYDYDRTIEENSQETMNMAKAFEEHVRRIVADADKDLLHLKYTYESEGADSPVLAAYVENLARDSGRTLVAIHNKQGIVIKSSLPSILATDRSDRAYYQVHQADGSQGLYIGLPIVGRSNGQTTIPLTRRLNKPDGSFGGIVYIGLSADYFLSYYQKIDLGNNQLLALSGLDGFIRVRQVDNNFVFGQNIMSGNFGEYFQPERPNASCLATNMFDGIPRITSYRIMPDYPLIVTIGKSAKDALSNFEKRRQGYILGALLVSLFIIVFCAVLINRYAKQRKINVELSRLERLNLVGEMAASIGHEIRNPLTTVRGYLQWYLHKEKYADLQMHFTTMIEELDRANAIITEFLSLAKNKSIELKKGNINDVLGALFPLLQAEAYNFGHVLQIEKSDVPDISMDGNELRQLVLNLVRNGFDAMQPQGTLLIKSYVEKDKVILVVSDTGRGITKSILDKLGTPFLTTKANGTGLGLAVCYHIAARHGARIDVETSSSGTAFYVKFEADRSN